MLSGSMTTKKQQETQLSLLKDQAKEIEKSLKLNSSEMIKAAENELLSEAMAVISPYMKFAEIGFGEDGEVNSIPFEWEGLPEEEKQKKIRLAKAGWMPSADTPHGVKMAHATVIGIIKAKSSEQSGTKILNIESVTFPSPAQKGDDYEVVDIEND